MLQPVTFNTPEASNALVRLCVHNVELYGYHGVLPQERVLGGKYALDVEVWYNAARAAQTDQVECAVNYSDVVETVVRAFETPRHLLEALSEAIIHAVMERFPSVERVVLRIRKLSVPLGRPVAYVELEQCKQRSDKQRSNK
jgi:dihydroneopterin aldolase